MPTGSGAAPMALDESVETTVTPHRDVDGVPYCPKHHCRMEQASGGKKDSPTVYYKCKVRECDEKDQLVKTANENIVPPQPLACPRCTGSKGPIYCEKDTKSSTAAAVVLRCPCCGWKSNMMAVPQFAAAHAARKNEAPVEEIGGR